jgi:hypothetical protein
MKMENLTNSESESERFQVRNEIQVNIACLDTGATLSADSIRDSDLIVSWVLEHAESFAQAWDRVVEAHPNIVSYFHEHPDEVVEQIRGEMAKVETLH